MSTEAPSILCWWMQSSPMAGWREAVRATTHTGAYCLQRAMGQSSYPSATTSSCCSSSSAMLCGTTSSHSREALPNQKSQQTSRLNGNWERRFGTPRYLGVIAPDSGLTSRRTRVYAVAIDSYRKDGSKDSEGICSISEATPEELSTSIRQGDIDDGYTIGAFARWMLSRQQA